MVQVAVAIKVVLALVHRHRDHRRVVQVILLRNQKNLEELFIILKLKKKKNSLIFCYNLNKFNSEKLSI